MLDAEVKQQVTSIFSTLQNQYTFVARYSRNREESSQLIEFINDMVSCSSNLSAITEETTYDKLEFCILRNNEKTGIRFRGIPNGHEFTSLLLAVLNADGKGKNLPDEVTARRIMSLNGVINLQTYVSLTCTNCPDVVQALNVMALINPDITHEMIDGALFQDEADARNVQAVPSVYANGRLLHVGRGSLGDLLQKLEDVFGSVKSDETSVLSRSYDVVVLGGGPAGASAAIYSARKGLSVAVVAERIGGQVKDTLKIENLISVQQTTGDKLAADLFAHMSNYKIDLFENRRIQDVQLTGSEKSVTVAGGEIFTAQSVIIATGAGWRKLNVAGESEYIGRGVAFCPHCDGPFYAGKDVAVVGGGNSGIEAAIDLAGICRNVTVVEFAESLRADEVLQRKLATLSNVKVLTSSQTTEIVGNGNKVTGIRVKNRIDETEHDLAVDGVFVLIGLVANSTPFASQIETAETGEIKIDAHCRTSVAGVYAAGDVSTVPYKQIVIAMGEGAKAALSAFDDRIREI